LSLRRDTLTPEDYNWLGEQGCGFNATDMRLAEHIGRLQLWVGALLGTPLHKAWARWGIANSYYVGGKLLQAHRTYAAAERRFVALGETRRAALVRGGRAAAAAGLGRIAEAEEAIASSIAVTEAEGWPVHIPAL